MQPVAPSSFKEFLGKEKENNHVDQNKRTKTTQEQER